MKIRNFVLFTILCVSSVTNGMIQGPKQRPVTCKDILQLVGSLLLPFTYYVPFHEFGHALAAKLLDGDPINIWYGCDPSEQQMNYLFKFGGFKIASFNLLKGAYASNSIHENKIKDSIILAAGPLFGALALLLIKKIIGKLFIKFDKNIYFEVLNIFYSILILDEIVAGLMPVGRSSSDGYRIWKNLIMDETKIKKIQKLSWIIFPLASGYYNAKKLLDVLNAAS